MSKNTKLLFLVTIYQKFIKKKKKKKTVIYVSKNLSPKARLQNEKVLGTHSAQTESGLLDSCDQCTLFFMHEMNDMLHMWNKLNHTNLFMNVSSPLLKNSDMF